MESLSLFAASGTCFTQSNPSAFFLKLQTWVKLIYYLDFQNQKMYVVIPSNNFFYECVLDPNTTVKSFLLKSSNWIGSQATTPSYKYDNLVISAVNTVPLNTKDFISEKFNLYPNPVTNMLTITNSENITIKKLIVYDVSGKTIKEQKGNFEKENTLNVENLSAGTYILHVKTESGIAVKKVVKK